jgi:SAM-dependent methyltransferase
MSSRDTEPHVGDAATLRARLEAYYTHYYDGALGIPRWRELVAVRLADTDYERGRLARLEQALGRSVAGARLLNVGCGTGGFNVLARRSGADAWGVDASTEAAAIARLRVPEGTIFCARAEALPFDDERFDVAYCYSTLEHVADAGHAVREMIRVLKPGGQLYVHTPNRWACFEGHYKVFWLPGLPRPLSAAYLALRSRPTAFLKTLRLVTLAECRSLVEAAGGRITRILDDGARRPVSGPLWPLVRAYYRLFRIRPYVEFVAEKRRDP